jgi:hypothetical protein
MSDFSIIADTNIDELTGKTGGDTYNVNTGFTFTIDQHSRFGLNNNNSSATAATAMNYVNCTNGKVLIDGRYVRLIPYSGASGTIPTLNSLVTQGSASGKLMCIYSSLTAAPVVSGTIPASGWLMIKQWNEVEYTASALTLSGISGMSATAASFVGFLEILGDQSGGYVSGGGGGTTEVKGAWYEVGTTTGSNATTYQIPNN